MSTLPILNHHFFFHFSKKLKHIQFFIILRTRDVLSSTVSQKRRLFLDFRAPGLHLIIGIAGEMFGSCVLEVDECTLLSGQRRWRNNCRTIKFSCCEAKLAAKLPCEACVGWHDLQSPPVTIFRYNMYRTKTRTDRRTLIY